MLREANRLACDAHVFPVESRAELKKEKQVHRQRERTDRRVDKWRRKYYNNRSIDLNVSMAETVITCINKDYPCVTFYEVITIKCNVISALSVV
jgi:hypothetical protein